MLIKRVYTLSHAMVLTLMDGKKKVLTYVFVCLGTTAHPPSTAMSRFHSVLLARAGACAHKQRCKVAETQTHRCCHLITQTCHVSTVAQI